MTAGLCFTLTIDFNIDAKGYSCLGASARKRWDISYTRKNFDLFNKNARPSLPAISWAAYQRI